MNAKETDQAIVRLVRENPCKLSEAFQQAAKETGQTPAFCAGRWYNYLKVKRAPLERICKSL